MVSAEGRSYLDMVNNVTPLGHAHPRVEQAISRQLRRLNTNSRFHYAAVVQFTERLAALLPAPLDTVFLVNSGSEAVDLAIRLAIGATGQHDVVALREAYHGWTYASDAVSTSLQDNPNALATRPSWVHTVDSPNSYRGRWRGEQADNYALEAVQVIDELAASGRPAGAFLSESYYGNAGGVALPDGYLQQVYAAVRRHGGLAIADEIQVGYGRLGTWFWGFEQQQAVPDIVCVAKAMGNGHPLGAVITTRAVADLYRDQGYFFSSTGGSPVSSVAGLTVLDTLRDEDLQGNAVRTGAHLKASSRPSPSTIPSSAPSTAPASTSASNWCATATLWSPPPRRRPNSASVCSTSASSSSPPATTSTSSRSSHRCASTPPAPTSSPTPSTALSPNSATAARANTPAERQRRSCSQRRSAARLRPRPLLLDMTTDATSAT